MTRTRSSALLVGALFLGLAVVLWARPAADATAADPGSGLRIVRVAPVDALDVPRTVRLPGVTRSARRAALSFPHGARLVARPVEVGDRVASGQLLARLDERDARIDEQTAGAALAEVEVRLGQAARDAARVERLADARAATAEELERATASRAALAASRDAAVSRLADARRRLADATLVAPFAGTVTAVTLEPGEWAAPGRPVVEIAGAGAVEVRVETPASALGAIAPDALVEIDLPMAGRTVTGRVTAVAGAAGPGALFPVIVALDDEPGLAAGLAAEVALPLGRVDGIGVPVGAVLDSGSSRPSVFRVEDGVARRVAVEPIELVGDLLLVRSDGLAAGDFVAISGQTGLVDGDRVTVR